VNKGTIKVGLCPSYEYLFDNISARAHLKMAALIKGESDVEASVDRMIDFLQM